MESKQDKAKPEPDKKNGMTLTRIDKNIAQFGVDFIDTYGKQGQLIFDIMLFIANSYQDQKNLFGYGELDVHKFAKTLDYTRQNLQRKETDLYDEKAQTDKDLQLCFTSVLENALYKSTVLNLSFSDKVYDFSIREKSKTITAYQLLTSFTKHVSPVRKDAYYYTFNVSDVFTFHLSKYFLLGNLDYSKELRDKSCLFLYLWLIIIEDSLRCDSKTTGEANFDVTCKKAQIGYTRSAKKKFALNEKLKFIKEHTNLNFSWRFFNKSGKYSYGLELIFPDNIKFLTPEEKTKHALVSKQALLDAVSQNVIKYYREIHQPLGRLNQDNFKTWYNNKANLEAKLNIYYKTYSSIKNTSYDQAKAICYKNAKQFFSGTVQ